MSNTFVKWSVFFYGIILVTLGLVGYVIAESIPSVVMGGGLGFLLMVCSLLMFLEKRIGLFIATFLTLLLTSFFAYRYTMTKGNLMSALLAVLSGAMLIILLLHCARWTKK